MSNLINLFRGLKIFLKTLTRVDVIYDPCEDRSNPRFASGQQCGPKPHSKLVWGW